MSGGPTDRTGGALVSLLRVTATQMHSTQLGQAVLLLAAANEIERLTAAIEKHRDTFPDEACEGERELWATISTNQEKDH